MKQVPLGEERRDAIADAAIHLVATRGLRGLTHRAVDAEAGLPPGSTSYYLSTRKALLTACLDRMLAQDASAAVAGGSGGAPAGPARRDDGPAWPGSGRTAKSRATSWRSRPLASPRSVP